MIECVPKCAALAKIFESPGGIPRYLAKFHAQPHGLLNLHNAMLVPDMLYSAQPVAASLHAVDSLLWTCITKPS